MPKIHTTPINKRFNAKAIRDEAGDAEQRGDILLFWGDWPSQWYPSQFTIGNVRYSCAEQFMMASKARFFGDEDSLETILSSPYPKAMKEVGRQVKGFNAKAWNGIGKNGRGGIAREVIFQGNLAKFSQSPALRKKLLDTGDALIGEASPKDDIYGIGMGKKPKAWNPKNWTGWNWLGRCLMDVREAIKAGKKAAKDPVKRFVRVEREVDEHISLPKRTRKTNDAEGGVIHDLYGTGGRRRDGVLFRSKVGNTDLRDVIEEAVNGGHSLANASLAGEDLHGLKLGGAMLAGADLHGADLSKTDLNYANLKGANLRGANLTGVKTLEADFSKADLRDTKGLILHKRAKDRGAIYD